MRALLVFFLGVVMTVILTWPFPSMIASYYSDWGDYAFNGSVLRYNSEALISGRILNREDYFNGFQFYPYPYSLAYSDHLFVPSLIFTPIYLLTQNLILSVNLLTFLSFVLSFVTAFYTLKYFLKNFWASAIGASVFAFNPLTFVHFYGDHTQLLYKFFLPLLFLFAFQFFNSPNRKCAILFFLFFTINALTSSYFQIFSLIVLPLAAIPFLWSNWRAGNFDYFAKLTKNSLILLIFMPILLYFNLPYLEFSQKEMVVRPITENGFFSARLLDWFSPAPQSLLYGDIYKQTETTRLPRDEGNRFYGAEHTLFLNLIPMILFTLALIHLHRKRNGGDRKVFVFFLTLLISTFVFSFGPYFAGWNSQNGSLPLPYYFLYQWLPFLKGIRVPTRIEFLFYIPFAFFVGYGFLLCQARFTRKRLLVSAIFAFIILENLNQFTFNSTSPVLERFRSGDYSRESLQFLRGKNTFHLPVQLENLAGEAAYLNFAGQTGEKLLNGYSGYYPPDQISLTAALEKDLGETALKKLTALGIDYLVIHRDKIKPDDPEKYRDLENKYQTAAVLIDSQFFILNLKSLKFEPGRCGPEVKPASQLSTAAREDDNRIFWVLTVENQSDCYLTHALKQRYQTITFYPNLVKTTVKFKMPAVLAPGEKVNLTEIAGEMQVR